VSQNGSASANAPQSPWLREGIVQRQGRLYTLRRGVWRLSVGASPHATLEQTSLLTSLDARGTPLEMTWLRKKLRELGPCRMAKARFSEFLEASLTEGPQIVTRRGVEAAVLVPVETWRQLEQAARPRLKDLLLAESPRPRFPCLHAEAGAAVRPRPWSERPCTCSTRT